MFFLKLEDELRTPAVAQVLQSYTGRYVRRWLADERQGRLFNPEAVVEEVEESQGGDSTDVHRRVLTGVRCKGAKVMTL